MAFLENLNFIGSLDSINLWIFFYRCADKILNQLEIHADRVIATNGTASQNSAANANRNNLKQIATSLKNHHLTTDPVIIWNLCTYPEYFSLMSGSCHLDRGSNDEFSVECLLWFFQPTWKSDLKAVQITKNDLPYKTLNVPQIVKPGPS